MNSDEKLERAMPWSNEAEKAVLGAVMIEPHLADSVFEGLDAGDFYNAHHRVIFAAMAGLHRDRTPIDPITTANVLKRDGRLEDIGGTSEITRLGIGLPVFDSVDRYIAIVREKAALRTLLRECASIQIIAASEAQTAGSILENASLAIQKLADRVAGNSDEGDKDLADLAAQSVAAAENFEERKLIPTGLLDLNRQLGGGLEPGNLVILGARPSTGKTSLAVGIVEAASKAGYVVLFNSLEMPPVSIMDRMIAAEARVNLQDYRTGQLPLALQDKARRTAAEIAKLPLVIDGKPTLTPTLLRSRCRRVKNRFRRLDLVVIDYLQLMMSGKPSHQDNRRLEIESFTRALKLLALEMNVPVLCLSQLSRASETRANGKPVLSDLRESGSIEQDADVVMLIHRSQSPDQPSEIIVAKHRNGPTGSVPVMFMGSSARFESHAREAVAWR